MFTPAGLAALELRRSRWRRRGRWSRRRRRPARDARRARRRAAVRHHDFGGRPTRCWQARAPDRPAQGRADRRRALPGVGEQRERDGNPDAALELEFAQIYAAHERMLAEAGARDEGGLVIDALALGCPRGGAGERRLRYLLIDDAQELDLAAATLALQLGAPSVTVAGDPDGALRRYRGAGAKRLQRFPRAGHTVVTLDRSRRCPAPVWRAARASAAATTRWGPRRPGIGRGLALRQRRSQAQSLAVESSGSCRRGAPPGEIAVLVSEINHEGRRSPPRWRSGRSHAAWSARRRSSSEPRSAICWPGCDCSPTRPMPPRWSARSPARRSSCGRSISPAAPRSRAGASSTWSARWRRRWSRRRCRPRPATESTCSPSSTAPAPRRSTRPGPTSMSTG